MQTNGCFLLSHGSKKVKIIWTSLMQGKNNIKIEKQVKKFGYFWCQTVIAA